MASNWILGTDLGNWNTVIARRVCLGDFDFENLPVFRPQITGFRSSVFATCLSSISLVIPETCLEV
jgi:hypothetical protein